MVRLIKLVMILLMVTMIASAQNKALRKLSKRVTRTLNITQELTQPVLGRINGRWNLEILNLFVSGADVETTVNFTVTPFGCSFTMEDLTLTHHGLPEGNQKGTWSGRCEFKANMLFLSDIFTPTGERFTPENSRFPMKLHFDGDQVLIDYSLSSTAAVLTRN